MSKVDTLLAEFEAVCKNPKKAMDDFKAKTGKGCIGVLPVYAPEEIVYATGYLPVGIWGGKKPISKAATYLPAFACSIMQSILEMEIDGTYDDLAAVVISSPCDTLKCFGQKWKGKSPVIQFVHSQNRDFEASNTFMTEEYKFVKTKLEKILGITITDEAINKAIDVYNENRAVMRMFCEVAAMYPQVFDPVKRHTVIKARQFMDKAEHTKKVKELITEVMKESVVPYKGKKIILTGIMAEPNELLDVFKEFDLAVVADDLAQESRQFRTDVPSGSDPLYRLAKQWQNVDGCSLATDRDKPRGQMLVEMAHKYGADAIIVCMMKFCDPEEFDYPIMLQQFEAAGIRNLKIEIDQQSDSMEQIRTRVQSFVEMM
ncbi:MAG: 2-hydroxyacyl-CoA dehydratase family protein [Clostridia bacterium]|jgi:benzoyl-CoA reductase/2-hydroxyglutaryl-CoA dehydratase subunit BcrC/BadD/HgdB|nr:2-hydroxyacyl-CoA dehydratase family protein [Clostridia bacterium]MCI1998936.1 2-hydroxyacyl-CoA dehydratase family protein [Clostridia bacterium]MCI2013686.1 2-hydroxyacyl-CoA dehydratase family protein [Clostridia bacterium]